MDKINVSLIVNIACLIVAILGIYFVLIKHRKSKQKEKRAFISAKMINEDNRGLLVIKNEGQGVAKNIRIESFALGYGEAHIVMEENKFPYESLNPNEDFKINITGAKKWGRKVSATFIWDDKSKKDNRITIDISCLNA